MIFIGIDQLIKWVIISNVKLYQLIEVLPNVLYITHTKNTGAAFGMLKGMRVFFIIVTVAVLISVIVLILRTPAEKFNLSWSIVCVLIISGGIGNLIDRILWAEVTDYIKVQFFPAIFNFADICVVLGVVLLCVKFAFAEKNNARDK